MLEESSMGFFGVDILGAEGLQLTGAENKTSNRITLDPTTTALNNLRLAELNNAISQTAGLQGHLEGLQRNAYLSPETQQLLASIQGQGQQQGLDTSSYLNLAGQGLDRTPYARDIGSYYSPTVSAAQNITPYQSNIYGTYSNILPGLDANPYIQNLTGLNNAAYLQARGALDSSPYTQNLQQYGTGQYQQAFNTIDPSRQVEAANEYFRRIVSPELQGQYSLLGLGRSGANQEAQARAAAGIALPIQQQISQQQAQLAGQQANQLTNNQAALIGQNYNALTGLLGQQASQLYGSSANLYGQQLGLTGNLLGQQANALSNLANQGYGNTYQSSLGAAQALSGLTGQQYGAQAGIVQGLPGTDIALRNAYLSRLQGGLGASDYGRLSNISNLQGSLQGYLSALNATPYTPAPTERGTGTNNVGLLNTALAQGFGQGLGTAAGGSDRRIKENILDFDATEFLDKIKPYLYNYKNSTVPRAGIMAQDLESTGELGKNLVHEVHGIKYIEYGNAFNLMMACIASMHQRIKELESITTKGDGI